jgi:hypothetical protein
MFNFGHKFDEIKSSVIGFVLMIACAIIGLIWISVALYNLLSTLIGPLWGPVALGGLFLLPIVIYGIVRLAAPKDKRSKQQKMFDAAFANTSVGSISRMIEAMSPHSPLLAAAVATIGGFVATRFPQFLSMFSELVGALGDELTRHKARKADDATRRAEAYEESGRAPPPPDVEPTTKRRSKAKVDSY